MRAWKKVNIVFLREKDGKKVEQANIAVKVTKMAEFKDPSYFHNSCSKGHRLNQQSICHECNEVIESIQHKIIETEKGNQLFDKTEIEGLKDYEKTITVLGRIPLEKLDPRRITEGHYLLPRQAKDGKSKLAKDSYSLPDYAVLQQSLINGNTALLVEYSFSKNQKLGIITTHDNELVLKEYRYAEFIRENDEDLKYEISELEQKSGLAWINLLSELDPNEPQNDYEIKISEIMAGKKPQVIVVEQVQPRTRFFET